MVANNALVGLFIMETCRGGLERMHHLIMGGKGKKIFYAQYNISGNLDTV